jgi:hypothetical protein
MVASAMNAALANLWKSSFTCFLDGRDRYLRSWKLFVDPLFSSDIAPFTLEAQQVQMIGKHPLVSPVCMMASSCIKTAMGQYWPR